MKHSESVIGGSEGGLPGLGEERRVEVRVGEEAEAAVERGGPLPLVAAGSAGPHHRTQHRQHRHCPHSAEQADLLN